MTATFSQSWVPHNRTALLSGFLFFAISVAIVAQETSLEQLPGLRERGVIMRVVSRIVEQNQVVVWNSENTKITMPGRPVGLKLVGPELVVVVQFTPFLRSSGQHTLVAQSQIWVNIPGEGMSFQTAMQTIPLEFGEQIYFYPLGSVNADDTANIEIQLVVEPYNVDAEFVTRPEQGGSAPSGAGGRGERRAIHR